MAVVISGVCPFFYLFGRKTHEWDVQAEAPNGVALPPTQEEEEMQQAQQAVAEGQKHLIENLFLRVDVSLQLPSRRKLMPRLMKLMLKTTLAFRCGKCILNSSHLLSPTRVPVLE